MAAPLSSLWNPEDRIGDALRGRRGLVVGIANQDAIAFAPREDLHGRVVAYLVSPAASGMTGDTIHVDGGLHDVA